MNMLRNFNLLQLMFLGIFLMVSAGETQAQRDLFPGGPGLSIQKTPKPSYSNLYTGGTAQLKKTDAASCVLDTCLFYVNFRIDMGTADKADISPWVSLEVENGDKSRKQMRMRYWSISQWDVLPIRIKAGLNIVRLTIDPDNKITETSETNNSQTWKFFLEPGPIVIPGKKTSR